MISVYYAQQNYDAVLKINKDGTIEPYFEPIMTAQDDFQVLKATIEKYKVSSDDTPHYLVHNATCQDFTKTYEKISDTLEKNKNFVIFQLFSCHGIHKRGTQYVTLNQFRPNSMEDQDEGFYELLPAEETVRDMAAKHSNSYWVTIFACCREVREEKKNGRVNKNFKAYDKKLSEELFKL